LRAAPARGPGARRARASRAGGPRSTSAAAGAAATRPATSGSAGESRPRVMFRSQQVATENRKSPTIAPDVRGPPQQRIGPDSGGWPTELPPGSASMLIDLSGVARSLREDTFAAALVRLRDEIRRQL